MIYHTIPPVFDANSRILILGTMPSPRSRAEGFFYGHPQNRFWRVLSAVLEEPLPVSVAEKKAMLLRRGIALWDVLASCEIAGASDSSIRNPVLNDFAPIFSNADIKAVFTTGKTAAKLYFPEKRVSPYPLRALRTVRYPLKRLRKRIGSSCCICRFRFGSNRTLRQYSPHTKTAPIYFRHDLQLYFVLLK